MPADSTVKDLDQLHRMGKASRARLEPEWMLNMAMYSGNQWVAFDGGRLYQPTLKRGRITIVDNRIQPAVRIEVAKLTKTRPTWVVTPDGGSDDDAHAAKLGETLMRFMWTHLGMRQRLAKGLLWSRITGAGFLKVFWDPTLGDSLNVLVGPGGEPLPDPQTGRPMRATGSNHAELSRALGVAITPKRVSQGDVVIEVRSPFQIYPDPLADVFDECEWVIEESIKSVEHVKRQYGVELEADTPANPGIVQSRMGTQVQTSGGYKGVKVREYWAGMSSRHPHGKRTVWAKDKLLLEDDHPFDALPYVMLRGIEEPGRLWPGSIVTQLRGPQTELNKVKSQIAENRNRVGNPTIVASKQTVQDPEKFAASMTTPGGIYYFDDTSSPNAVPAFLQAPALPAYVVQEIDRIEKSIQEIAGQHEVTSANVPPGVTAASAINLLMEADDTRLGPAVTDMEDELGKLGAKVLALVARYYTDARTVALAGDNEAWEIFDFKGAMLRGNTHVKVQAGSAFPQSKAGKQAAMQDLLTFFVQSGNAPHGRQLAQFLEDWEVGGAERLIEDYSRDETQVNRENARLAQGQQVPINPFDNDQAHLTGHQDFQKAARYDQLPPPVRGIFQAHVEQHRQRIAAQQQALQQMVQPGVPPAPGQLPATPAPPPPETGA